VLSERGREEPSMMHDKEIDLFTLSELSDESGAEDQSPSTGEKRIKKRFWYLLIIFLAGIFAGWFFYEIPSLISPRGEFANESIEVSKGSILPSPFDSINLEIKNIPSRGKKTSKKRVSLENGASLTIAYGVSELRYRNISLKRGWLESLFSESPGIYLNGGGEISPNEDIVRKLEPETSTEYQLIVRFNKKSKPSGSIFINLEMSPEGWIYRISQLKGEKEKQKLCYEKAERLGSINAELLNGYAELLIDLKQVKPAARKYEKALKREPENFAALSGLSALYIDMNPQKALNLLGRLIQLDPKNKATHYRSLAKIQQQLGLGSLWMTYKALIELNPKDTTSKRALDKIYIGLLQKAAKLKKEERLQEAIMAVEEGRKIYLTRENTAYLATLHHDLGSQLVKQGRYDTAVLQYESSIKTRPDLKTYLSLAKTYGRLGRTSEAIHTIEQAKTMDSKSKDKKITRELLTLEEELLSSNR
jgi:tetratricopeptide (TPR) repeat protein